jgi:ABC-type multidrug transport system fused ATPase/permease subunit
MARRNRFDTAEDKDKKKVTLQSLRMALRVFRYLLPYKSWFLAGMFFLLISGLTSLVFPYVTGQLVDAAVGNLSGWTRNDIALLLLGVLGVQALFSFIRVLMFSRVSEMAMKDIRLQLYSKMLVLPVTFFEKRRVGELTSRLTSDVTQLQDVLAFTLPEFIRQVTTLIVGVIVIFVTSVKLTLVMLASFPFMVIGAVIFGKYIRRLSKKVTDELAAANVIAEETLQSIHTVKSFSNEQYETYRFSNALQNVVKHALHTARFRGAFISFIIFAIFGGIVFVLWFGLGLVAEGQMTIGSLVSFIIYTTFIGAAAGGMGDLYGQLQKTVGASERVMEILDQEEYEKNEEGVHVNRLEGAITFEHVRFAYPTRPEQQILKDIYLHIAAGQKIALVGKSGAGKSTLVQLLLRFYNLAEGRILVDGKDIQTLNIQDYRKNIGVVPQEVLLFGGTIKENIAYGKPNATDEEIIDAAHKANAWEFIRNFPERLNTVVGERGIKLSGGQRQRVAIARAILKDPAILILDEATSSLDAESEQLVQEALDVLMQNRTTIIIAHRLATVRKADMIYVISDGTISEQGSHETLLLNENGIYQNLVKMQFELS